MVKITSLLSCAMLLFFVVLENSLLAIENNVLLVQQNKTVNGITFSITNAKVLDSDAVSTLVVYKKVNYKRQVLDVVVAYSVGMPNSFYFIENQYLSDHFIAIHEFTGGGSCCEYTHIFSIKPIFSKLLSQERGVSFVSTDTIRISRDRPGVDHSKYANCCRPQRVYLYTLTGNGLQLISERDE